jgi:hypothetical protein
MPRRAPAGYPALLNTCNPLESGKTNPAPVPSDSRPLGTGIGFVRGPARRPVGSFGEAGTTNGPERNRATLVSGSFGDGATVPRGAGARRPGRRRHTRRRSPKRTRVVPRWVRSGRRRRRAPVRRDRRPVVSFPRFSHGPAQWGRGDLSGRLVKEPAGAEDPSLSSSRGRGASPDSPRRRRDERTGPK